MKGVSLFALSIFTGAFLLFQVQPLIGKFILPWFGGAPAIWTTCMLFFQAFLLAGYAYAHLSARYLKPRAQVVLHLALLLAALAALPIMPAARWKPVASGDPSWAILGLLTVCVGLPYFVLAATGPLLQAWFSRLNPGRTPYRLYALSNAGSLLALISFPFIFEPAFTRKTQAALWGWGLVAFVLFCGVCAVYLWRANPPAAGPEQSDAADHRGPPPLGAMLRWFCLPACASVLLLATTNQICQDVAVIPFLWILPLSIYLLTFILCFDSPRWYYRPAFGLALIPALGLVFYALYRPLALPLWGQVGAYSFGLFVCGMVCHGELYRFKPAPRHLTSFYLMIAAGGAAGGVFVSILAPLIFQTYLELHCGLWAIVALLLWIHAREQTVINFGPRQWRLWP
jgi:MFS family permease